MAVGEVGDDGWEEDPNNQRLQQRAGEMVGKEASLFVPSGTMGNLCALLSHTQAGEEVIVEGDSHIFHSEVAGGPLVGRPQPRPPGSEGGPPRPAPRPAAPMEAERHQSRTAP